jgi:hypothetical protein
VQEEVAVDLAAILRAGPDLREATDEHVGPVAVVARAVVLHERVVADDRDRRAVRHAVDGRARRLPLDLHPVADRVGHEVALDDAPDEGVRPVGVAEVHPGPCALDAVAPDDPAPRRRLGGDRDGLLGRVVADERTPLDADVVHPVALAAAGADPERAVDAPTVDRQPLEREVGDVAELDRVAAGTEVRGDDRRFASGRAADRDPGVGRALQGGEVEPIVRARCEREGVPRDERRDDLLVVGRVGREVGPGSRARDEEPRDDRDELGGDAHGPILARTLERAVP